MEAFAKGRNYNTNEPKILNVNDNGELKTELNSKLDEIESNFKWVNKYNILNDIRMIRNKGFCYNFSTFGNTNAETKPIFEIFNNTTSNYKLYIYNISYAISNISPNYVQVKIRFFKTTSITSGTNISSSASNLKVNGDSLPSDISIRNAQSSITVNRNILLNNVRFTNSTELELLDYNEFMEEMIEVPPGVGFACILEQANYASLNDLNYSTNIRFFIMNKEYDYPFTEDDQLNSIENYFNGLTFGTLTEIPVGDCVIS